MNYYQLLHIRATADQCQIRKAYFKQALLYHPDRNNSNEAVEKFKAINEAYRILKDPDLRRNYDLRLKLEQSNVMVFPTMNDIETMNQVKEELRAKLLYTVGLRQDYKPDDNSFDIDDIKYRCVEPLLKIINSFDAEKIAEEMHAMDRREAAPECVVS